MEKDRLDEIMIEVSKNDKISFDLLFEFYENYIFNNDLKNDKKRVYCLKELILQKVKQQEDSIFLEIYTNLDEVQLEIFWIIFNDLKLFNQISSRIFKQFLTLRKTNLIYILKHKELVKKYDTELSEIILENYSNVFLIIRLYNQKYNKFIEKLYFPDSLSKEKIEKFLKGFFESDFSNINGLKEIMKMKSGNFISGEIQLMAKRKYEELSKKIFSNKENKYGYNYIIEFLENQIEEYEIEIKGSDIKYTYSLNWLINTLDYPSIFNNFIYLFEFVDSTQMRFTNIVKEINRSIFDELFNSKNCREYPSNFVFDLLNDFSFLKMHGYYSFLKGKGLKIEDGIYWFFTEYVSSEFNVPVFSINNFSSNLTYFERCCLLPIFFDSIVRQFSMYVENKKIDYELIEFNSNSIRFENIPTLLENKYVYKCGDNYSKIIDLLFSDVSSLLFDDSIANEYKYYHSFYRLLESENISYDEFSEFNKEEVKFLIKYDLVYINNSLIKIKNRKRVNLLLDMYYHEYISKYHFSDDYSEEINNLVKLGIFKYKTSFLSEQESAYFDYFLNRSNYDNGLDLRNKYLHGSYHVVTDENTHYNNYLIILYLLIIFIIKINDELYLVKKYNKNKM